MRGIRPRRRDLLAYAGVAVAAVAGGAHFLLRGSTAGVVGCLFAALMALGAMLLLAGEADCPACGERLTGLALAGSGYVRCGACRRYFAREGTALSAIGEAHVADRAEFSVPLGPGFRPPALCCSCGAAASREELLELRAAGPVAHGSPVGMSLELKVPAPFCAAHGGDARVTTEDLAQFPGITAEAVLEGPKTDHRFVLKVRSYAFYRRAAALS